MRLAEGGANAKGKEDELGGTPRLGLLHWNKTLIPSRAVLTLECTSETGKTAPFRKMEERRGKCANEKEKKTSPSNL